MKTISFDAVTGEPKQSASGSMQVPTEPYIEVDVIPDDLYQNWRVDVEQDPPVLVPLT